MADTGKGSSAKANKKSAAVRAAAARARAAERAALARQLPSQQAEGFMNFIRQQGVVGLAIGLVLGTQIKVLVDQFLASFVNPILGIVLPGKGDLTQKQFALHAWGERAEFAWGQFMYVLMSFIIVALIIYYIVKGLRLDKLHKKD